MYQFNIEDMTYGHCVSRVTKAVKAVHARAQIEISLRDKRVNVRSSAAQDVIAEAILAKRQLRLAFSVPAASS